MKRTNLFSKVIIALFAMGLIFTSCDNDDPNPGEGAPDDETIPIDDNSAFNMGNFIASFDQMFVADNRWAWDFSHDYTDGKAMMSYQNYKVFGKFGEGVFTITHTYNAEGVITSSERNASDFESNVITFTYEYNIEGYIVELTKKVNGEIRDVVTMEYNSSNQLIKKTHDDDEEVETFTYNSDGTVASYIDDDGDKIEYKYSNGNMIEMKEYYEGELDEIQTLEYDSEGRVIKMYGDEDYWYSEVQYSSEMMTFSEYYDDLLEYKEEYGIGFIELRSYRYEYDDNDIFEYCTVKENDDEGYTSKKYYYEGFVDNLQLVGYSVIDSRDENKDYKKLKESVYNASGTKLYYAEFSISGSDDYWWINETYWYTPDGSLIDEFDISESWVFVLVK